MLVRLLDSYFDLDIQKLNFLPYSYLLSLYTLSMYYHSLVFLDYLIHYNILLLYIPLVLPVMYLLP